MIFDAAKEKDGQADITQLIVANVLNNNKFIQIMLKIKIKLQIYINVLYQDQEYNGKCKAVPLQAQRFTGS